jgi:hypothetical protein
MFLLENAALICERIVPEKKLKQKYPDRNLTDVG